MGICVVVRSFHICAHWRLLEWLPGGLSHSLPPHTNGLASALLKLPCLSLGFKLAPLRIWPFFSIFLPTIHLNLCSSRTELLAAPSALGEPLCSCLAYAIPPSTVLFHPLCTQILLLSRSSKLPLLSMRSSLIAPGIEYFLFRLNSFMDFSVPYYVSYNFLL